MVLGVSGCSNCLPLFVKSSYHAGAVCIFFCLQTYMYAAPVYIQDTQASSWKVFFYVYDEPIQLVMQASTPAYPH